MYYGVSYYPEQKTAEELEQDLKLLEESGINTVRMGEFTWCRMEPEEGKFDFSWLDPVVERLGKAGISTILCTPTACPPAWMITKYPEILYMDNRGVRRPFGGRRHYCYNNERYRFYSRRIAEKIGEHYGKNPYVAGFQIDNEPAQEGTGRCHCPVCQDKFREWLKKKYGTVKELNRRGGLVFWSQEYQDFSQIMIPVNGIEANAGPLIQAYHENPTLRMDFEQFASDSQIEYQNLQAEALHAETKVPVTTNTTGLATNSIDYYESTRGLDCFAFDYYPRIRDAKISSFAYAFARNVKKDTPFWVLEFMAGGGHSLGGVGRIQPNPGALKLAAAHAMACGAEMLLHFQYRTFPWGAEQLNYAIVDMDGVPRRRYYEMQETAALLKELEPLWKSRFACRAAVCFDYRTYWALKIKPVSREDFDYLKYCERLYHLLEGLGIQADVISYDEDFDRYEAVFLPTAFVMPESMREKCRDYVRKGGKLAATFLTGVKNRDNAGYTETLPAGMTDLFGVEIEELEPVISDTHMQVRLKIRDGGLCRDGIWSEWLKGEARPLAVYEEGYKKGRMVISENPFGEGKAFYIGTDLPDAEMKQILSHICEGIERSPIHVEEASGQFEVIHRNKDGKDYYFVFNFTSENPQLRISRPLRSLRTGKICRHLIQVKRVSFEIFVAVP